MRILACPGTVERDKQKLFRGEVLTRLEGETNLRHGPRDKVLIKGTLKAAQQAQRKVFTKSDKATGSVMGT